MVGIQPNTLLAQQEKLMIKRFLVLFGASFFVFSTQTSMASEHEKVERLKKYSHYEVGQEKIYLDELIKLMPKGADADSLKTADAKLWVIYGLEICENLASGADEKQQRADGASFYGPDLGNALVDAAKTVICP